METTIIQAKGQVSNPNLVGLNDAIVHIDSTGSNTRTKLGCRATTANLSTYEIANVVSGDALIYTSEGATTGGVTSKVIPTGTDLWVGVGKFDVIIHNVPNILKWNLWSANATYDLNRIVPILPDELIELTCMTTNFESSFDIKNLSRFKSLSYIGLTGKKIYGPLSVLSDSSLSVFGHLQFENSYVYGSIAIDLTAHSKTYSKGDFSGSLITA